MNDMKCPFCNKPLRPTHRSENEYWCENDDCTGASWKFGSISLWQELIRTKKELNDIESKHEKLLKHIAIRSNREQELRDKLDIAVDALKGIKAFYDDSYADPHTFVNWHIVAQRLANDADDAIKAITALEQKDK